MSKVIVDRDGKEHHFPPKLDLDFKVVENRVQTRSLEAHIVDHCNLTCAQCCSLSPMLPKWSATVDELRRDLLSAKALVAPKVFKLVGGEPLLHPKIADMAQVAKESGIAPRISLTTNGVLLTRTEDALWEHLDAITVSVYPSANLSEESHAFTLEQGRRFGVKINWKECNDFVQMNRVESQPDNSETEAVFADCWLRGRCHCIRNGVFTACTRPPHMQSLDPTSSEFDRDGYDMLSKNASAQGLLAYLQREEPLESCAYCNGGAAPEAPHRQIPRTELVRIRK